MDRFEYIEIVKLLASEVIYKTGDNNFCIPSRGAFSTLEAAKRAALLSFYQKIDKLNRQFKAPLSNI